MSEILNEPPKPDTAADRPGDAAGAAEADAPTPDPADELRRERDALQDRLLRTAAEFDNYRKRMERERRELSDHAAAAVVRDLLPILDNFERALQAPAG